MPRELTPYTTIEEDVCVEWTIKKSRFIGQLFPVSSPEEAGEKLAVIRKKYWDATHNCSAFIVGFDRELMRCSDDGEPAGTAGVPMLEALKGTGLTNLLVVVTRYFGGTLLGRGGLTRAYAQSVTLAAQEAKPVRYSPVSVYDIDVAYPQWGRVEAALLGLSCSFDKIDYGKSVQVRTLVPLGQEGRMEKALAEATAGQSIAKYLGAEYLRTQL